MWCGSRVRPDSSCARATLLCPPCPLPAGAQELLADVQWGLLQRFAARGIKFVSGLSDGGSGTSSSAAALQPQKP